MPKDITVIGAGIIGVSIALELQSRGHAVRLLDRSGIAAESSRGAAGAFAFADIFPLAAPGIIRKAPAWLFDPLGPLSIRPSYAPTLAPWLVRFWRASRPARYDASVAAQSKLMDLSRDALDRQIASVRGEPLILRQGQLQLYEGEREFQASLPEWELRRRHGIAFQLLDNGGEIADIQPGLSARFTHAGLTPNWINTTDPKAWTEHIAQAFIQRGGTLQSADVHAISACDQEAEITTSSGTLRTSKVVVAAGAWSHHLARTIGDKIPLETERGYNTTLPAGAFDLRTHLTFPNHGFVVTSINNGIRVGGAVELGGLTLPPNYKRAETLLQKAASFMPGLRTEEGTQWMGFRPSLPDSLPVISPSPKARSVFYAFGHGHLGLTQAAGTAELMALLIGGETTPLPMAPYSSTRF